MPHRGLPTKDSGESDGDLDLIFASWKDNPDKASAARGSSAERVPVAPVAACIGARTGITSLKLPPANEVMKTPRSARSVKSAKSAQSGERSARSVRSAKSAQSGDGSARSGKSSARSNGKTSSRHSKSPRKSDSPRKRISPRKDRSASSDAAVKLTVSDAIDEPPAAYRCPAWLKATLGFLIVGYLAVVVYFFLKLVKTNRMTDLHDPDVQAELVNLSIVLSIPIVMGMVFVIIRLLRKRFTRCCSRCFWLAEESIEFVEGVRHRLPKCSVPWCLRCRCLQNCFRHADVHPQVKKVPSEALLAEPLSWENLSEGSANIESNPGQCSLIGMGIDHNPEDDQHMQECNLALRESHAKFGRHSHVNLDSDDDDKHALSINLANLADAAFEEEGVYGYAMVLAGGSDAQSDGSLDSLTDLEVAPLLDLFHEPVQTASPNM